MQHSNEYKQYILSPQWRSRSVKCQQLTKNTCVVFPWKKSNHAHHLTYKNFKNEQPLRDIVPLSKDAHQLIHCHLLWKTNLRFVVNWWLRISFLVWILIKKLR